MRHVWLERRRSRGSVATCGSSGGLEDALHIRRDAQRLADGSIRTYPAWLTRLNLSCCGQRRRSRQ